MAPMAGKEGEPLDVDDDGRLVGHRTPLTWRIRGWFGLNRMPVRIYAEPWWRRAMPPVRRRRR
jgi:hypothetical protein